MTVTFAEDEPVKLIANGWVQGAGEIRIYANKADLGKRYEGVCTSGLMTHGRTMPAKYQNQFVAVYGRLVDEQTFTKLLAQGFSAGLENQCGGRQIAIIERLVLK